MTPGRPLKLSMRQDGFLAHGSDALGVRSFRANDVRTWRPMSLLAASNQGDGHRTASHGPEEDRLGLGCPAVCQLHMRDLPLCPLTTEDGKVLAPVELKCIAGPESQGHKGAAPCRLLFTLTVCSQFPGKDGHAVVRPREAERDQIGMHLLQSSAVLARTVRRSPPSDTSSLCSATNTFASRSRGAAASHAVADVGSGSKVPW